MALLFLEFVAYFGSNIFLARYAQRKINEATKEVYLIDFNRFNLSLLRRGFFLDGLVMKPVNSSTHQEDQVLFDFTLDQVGVTGLWYDFSEHEFTVSKIRLDNPSISMQMPPGLEPPSQSNSGEKQISPIKRLELEIRKSVEKMSLAGLRIKEVEMEHANLFFFNFLSRGNLKADDTKLLVKNINLTTLEDWKTPFNAEGFVFELEGVEFPLPDGVHSILAQKVNISSLDNLVDIKNFVLISDKTKESKAYYDVELDKLLMGNVDLNHAFMTSEMQIDELVLNRPNFKVVRNSFLKSDSTASGDLNDLIRGNLNSIQIKELSINKGKFIKSELSDSLKNRIEIDELDFKMIQFFLGMDSLKRENQFFYGEDASMQIRGGRLFLGDGVHLVSGDEVMVSSFRDDFSVKNLSIRPIKANLANSSAKNLMRIALPEFSLNEVDLKKLYNEGIISASGILLVRPEVELVSLENRGEETVEGSFGNAIKGFLNLADIEKFEVQEGTIKFTDERGQRSSDVGFDKFSILLEGLKVDPDTLLAIHDQITAREIYLSLDNYQLKLKDNLHLIFAEKLKIDSRNSLLEVQNLKIKPQSQEQIQNLLDIYGKTSAINFAVPLFRAEGIDINSAFYDQILRIGTISMPQPEFEISTYRAKEKKNTIPQSTDDVKGLLLGYFNSISIDSIDLFQAKIKYESLVENKKNLFQEDNLTLKLKNFFLDPSETAFTGKTLFSEEIDLTFSDYSFSLGNGKYTVETDLLNYNSKKESLVFDNLLVYPGENSSGRLALGLDFPKVIFKGVDIEQFVFDNVLDLQKLEISEGRVEIGIDRKISTTAKERERKRLTQKTVDWVSIDTIQAKNSFLELNFLGENNSLRSIQTGFGFLIQDFHLDTLVLDQNDLSKLYSTANLDLNDFVFALPDSVHTVSFSKVQLGDAQKEIVFSDLKITPKNFHGNPGEPVVNAKMDELAILNNRFQDVMETKRFDMKNVRMLNPVLDVYLDKEKYSKPPRQDKRIEEEKNSLVESMILGDFQLSNGKIQLHRKGEGPISRLGFTDVDFKISDLGLDFLDQKQELDLKELAGKNLSFSFKNYQILTPDSLYKTSFDQVYYENGGLTIKGLYVRPVQGNYGLLNSLPYQTDAVRAKVDKVSLSGLDPVKYLKDEIISGNDLRIEGARIDLFRDKRKPFNPDFIKEMPQFMMSHAQINADFQVVQVRDGRVRYYEIAPKGNLPGMISFDQIQLDLAPFYLRKESAEYPIEKLRLGIETKIMDQSNVSLKSEMYFTEKYPMNVSIAMDRFRFEEANDFLMKTMFVKAVDGEVTEGQWDFTLNEDYAIGKMALGYKDLKIQFVDSLTYERGLGKLKVYTFGANLLAKNNNPRGGSKKITTRRIYLERDNRRFVFSTWWKATFSGLRGTFGLGKPRIPKELRKEED
ncbi:hypothetical protein [Algoriphagus mannitolivorans]|uniref:hypothetical protein n=1 Tax=Algoriphagus mannitolivorans TaxID=226504 RepID=UPI0012F8B0DC|nr:hypothetical protein [Algoriphagus mannitolivorans]